MVDQLCSGVHNGAAMAPQEAFSDSHTTRTEWLAESIRLDIVRNVFPPASRLTEEALAAKYGMSRTPVREALRMLAREHLLVHRPHAGYIVASLELDEMDDLYSVRVAIEERVASRIISSQAFEPLVELLEFWGQDAPAADVNLVFADERFHEALALASGSSTLEPMLRNINQRLHALRIRDFIDQERVRITFEQHTAILRALLAQDERLSQALLRSHIWQSYNFVRTSAQRAQAL